MKLSVSIDYTLFSLFKRPGIYAWKRGETYLYIGCSEVILRRLIYHNIIDRVEPFMEGDIVELWTFDDNADYLSMMVEEDKLIEKHKPIYSVPVCKDGMNREKGERTCPMCKKKFMQNRYWQKFCSRACGGGRPIISKTATP